MDSREGSGRRRWRRVLGRRTVRLLLAITALALAVRLLGLGTRVFHWDEGRVGYWTLRYAATGVFEYRPIVHGPFLQLVNATLFGVAPATDAVARLVVALVGGLVPLAAWLFRDHLRDPEVLALAVLLAANPILVYYSRFMRNDVLVAGFSLFALGFAVRAHATRDVRRLYPAVGFLALAFTTKGNALLYLLCFAGAGVLLLDHRLVRETASGRSIGTVLDGWLTGLRTGLGAAAGDRRTLPWLGLHLAGLAGVFLGIVAFFYAPRPELWNAVSDPALLPGVIREATTGSARELVDLWLHGGMQEHDYLEYFRDLVSRLTAGAMVVVAFALVGFVVDAYVGVIDASGSSGAGADAAGRLGTARPLVAFAAYWAVASLLGYPAATDIRSAWVATHVVVPAAIPAAVGLAYVSREARTAFDDGDLVSAGLAGIVLVAAVSGLIVPNVTYWNAASPQHDEMVQWAQPHNDIRDTLEDVDRAVAAHDGEVDVLFVGSQPDPSGRIYFYVEDESSAELPPAGGPAFLSRMPLPWYLERSGATVDSVSHHEGVAGVPADPPPVVIAMAHQRDDLEPRLAGYDAREHELRQYQFRVVFFIDEAYL